MNDLAKLLINRINQTGPMSIADYMAACLFHPDHGYYSTRQPLGRSGDFVTAPEISQMFGELLALSLAQSWMDQGAPERIILAELGPGRGTLMADVLRTARAVPGFYESIELHLIEASPTLIATQKESLEGETPTWHASAQDLPDDLPLFLLANEFFDALPIRQFVRDPKGWRERQIGASGGELHFGLSSPAPIDALENRLSDTEDGDLIEICPSAGPIMQTIAQRIENNGGSALIFDYGDWHSLGDTLQAIRNHESVSPLSEPGATDLTAHVDFEALIQDLPCRYSRLTPQGVTLERLGITSRAQALAQNMDEDTLSTHIAAHRRLTHPDEMGTVFKTIALFPHNANPPPGYET